MLIWWNGIRLTQIFSATVLMYKTVIVLNLLISYGINNNARIEYWYILSQFYYEFWLSGSAVTIIF